MSDYIQAWQCVGCGRIEAPQTCLGVCRDRKILMVAKDDHDRVAADAEKSRRRVDVALAMLARVVHSTPRGGQWEENYRALQQQARDAIAKIEAAG